MWKCHESQFQKLAQKTDNTWPSMPWMAEDASSLVAKVMKPKPLDLPVSRSIMTLTGKISKTNSFSFILWNMNAWQPIFLILLNLIGTCQSVTKCCWWIIKPLYHHQQLQLQSNFKLATAQKLKVTIKGFGLVVELHSPQHQVWGGVSGSFHLVDRLEIKS